MEFVQPYMLWGMAAVIIPVAIHFWHQKKGQPIDWAAMRWLLEKDQQQQRGLKIDNLLLLLLRCLLILLLAFLLSQPIVNQRTRSAAIRKIHLVQAEKGVTENFRFELEEALRTGEAVYWINTVPEPVRQLTQLPDPRPFNAGVLQTAINNTLDENTALHLYVVNDQRLAEMPFIQVPATYQLHTVADSVRKPLRSYLAFSANKNAFVDQAGRLTTNSTLAPAVRYTSTPAHAGSLAVLVEFKDKTEEQTVLAAIRALTEVYSLALQLDIQKNNTRAYDWILTDQDVANPNPKTLYVVSNQLKIPTAPNVVYTPERFSPQSADRVRNGQLPEWLGDALVRHFNLNPKPLFLSEQQLRTLFIPTAKPVSGPMQTVRNWLVLALVIVVGVERWLALRKNA
ncbi:hypothetical protein GCM10027347_13950 [Larkinella harenae]